MILWWTVDDLLVTCGHYSYKDFYWTSKSICNLIVNQTTCSTVYIYMAASLFPFQLKLCSSKRVIIILQGDSVLWYLLERRINHGQVSNSFERLDPFHTSLFSQVCTSKYSLFHQSFDSNCSLGNLTSGQSMLFCRQDSIVAKSNVRICTFITAVMFNLILLYLFNYPI